jgi:glycine dehydrogenase
MTKLTHRCWLIEPTESEPKHEIDRFIDALISIRSEVDEIVSGSQSKEDNVFKNAPHPLSVLTADEWDKPYSRQKAVFPVSTLKRSKFWPSVGRVDDGMSPSPLESDGMKADGAAAGDMNDR